jgi:hypothetical protein
VVAAAALVISDIVSGMDDDYYGTKVFVLGLPTNITDFIHSLPGHAIPGGFELESSGLGFQGSTSWPEGDGVGRRSRSALSLGVYEQGLFVDPSGGPS